MAEKKEKEVDKFTKEQITSAKKYEDYRDLISAMWTDESLKTTEQVDAMIDKFMKGQVN